MENDGELSHKKFTTVVSPSKSSLLPCLSVFFFFLSSFSTEVVVCLSAYFLFFFLPFLFLSLFFPSFTKPSSCGLNLVFYWLTFSYIKRASLVIQMVKNLSAGDIDVVGFIPGSRRSPGEGNDYSLQYSCLENSMDRGAWQAIIHGVERSQTHLSDWHFSLLLLNRDQHIIYSWYLV